MPTDNINLFNEGRVTICNANEEEITYVRPTSFYSPLHEEPIIPYYIGETDYSSVIFDNVTTAFNNLTSRLCDITDNIETLSKSELRELKKKEEKRKLREDFDKLTRILEHAEINNTVFF